MRCDDVRKSVNEGAPLDEAVRGHLAACPACAGEYEALRALVASRPAAPAALRERVLAAWPSPRRAGWKFLGQAAAFLLIGLGAGFAAGYALKAPREIVKEVPVEVTKTVPAPPSEDYISNVGIAARGVYGSLVEVAFDNEIHALKITVDPRVKDAESACPVARELRALSKARPDVVGYKKKVY